MARAVQRARTPETVSGTPRRRRAVAALACALACAGAVIGTIGVIPWPASASSVSTDCPASVTAGRVHPGRFLGAVRPVRRGTDCPAGIRVSTSSPSSSPAGSEVGGAVGEAGLYPGKPPLINHGGPVMATPTVGNQVVVTPIYWAPSGYSFTSSYENVINNYLADLAADSDRTTNVFATTFQYSGSNGAINYRMTRGTPITDTDAFPGAGCTISPGSIYADKTGYNTCLDDAQLISEVDSVVAAHGLARDLGHMYVLFLPKAVESCYYAGNPSNQECSINSTPSSAFCAYHSGFSGGADRGEVVYADMPFPIYSSATQASCTDEGLTSGTTQIQQPNGDPDADVEISPLSHEMAEAITDPEGNAWYDSSGYENGDDCAYVDGALSGTAGAYYNQTVNGHHYLTQEEFSNNDYQTDSTKGCQQDSQAVTPTVATVAPATGPDTGGTTVTITGTGFPGASAVRFGSTAATFTVVNATHITATAPAGTTGTVDVTVSTSAGTSATSSTDHYTFTTPAPPRPTVSKVSPNSGPTAGGTKVTIAGANLSGATVVSFGSHRATTFTVDVDRGGCRAGAGVRFGTARATTVSVRSSTRIVVRAPRHARGTVDVVVVTGGGSSPRVERDRYRYV